MALEQRRPPVGEFPPPGEKMRLSRWRHRLGRLLMVVFCAEIGLFLLVFPWLEFWEQNYLSGTSPQWYAVWTNPYFRGAVSGLGVVNLYISFLELLRLLGLSKS